MKFNMHFVAVLCFIMHQCMCSVLMPEDMGYGVEHNVVEGYQGSEAGVDECLKKDTISCIQIQLFRMAKDFFNRPSLDIYNGITLSKLPKYAEESRSLNSDGNRAEESIEKAQDAQVRESLLENYIAGEARNFLEKRNVKFNMAALTGSLMKSIPDSLNGAITDLMTEGRGRKKILRMLLPFVLGLKVKFATVLGLVYLGVILLAKKALFLSIVSIAISIFLFVKKMFHHSHEEAYPVGHGGWHSHSDAGHVEFASHNAPAAQNLAYGGQKTRR